MFNWSFTFTSRSSEKLFNSKCFIYLLVDKKWICLERNTPHRVWAISQGESG